MYLRRLIGVVIISVILITLIGKFFDYRYKKRWAWLFFDRMNTAISDSQDYDILLLGNSRIHTGVNPYYIDSVTKMSSYNLGIGSADEQEMKLLGTVYLQHHTPPKVVVLGVDASLLSKHNVLKERFAYLFYLDNDTVCSFMKKNGFPCELIKIAPFLKYSFFDEYNRTSLFLGSGNVTNIFKHNFNKGFINIFQNINTDTTSLPPNAEKKLFNVLPDNKKINDTSVVVFRQTVEMFISKGCQVIFLFPPELKKDKSPLSIIADSFYTHLASEYNIKEIRTTDNPVFKKEYFAEGTHLNYPGSEILSVIVADSINSFVQQKTKRY